MSLSDYFFDEQPMVISGQTVPSICNDFDPNYPSVVDRFFKRFYFRKPGTADEDHLVLFHSNRICLIGLAPRHVALRKGVESVTYNIGNVDRSQNQCSGKGKKGAMNLQSTSALALIKCIDGTEHKVLGCLNAKLIEVNHKLIANPSILAHEGDGYVAVCLPKMENIDSIKAALLSEEQYKTLIETEDATKHSSVEETTPQVVHEPKPTEEFQET